MGRKRPSHFDKVRHDSRALSEADIDRMGIDRASALAGSKHGWGAEVRHELRPHLEFQPKNRRSVKRVRRGRRQKYIFTPFARATLLQSEEEKLVGEQSRNISEKLVLEIQEMAERKAATPQPTEGNANAPYFGKARSPRKALLIFESSSVGEIVVIAENKSRIHGEENVLFGFPGGGQSGNKSIAETANREALEEAIDKGGNFSPSFTDGDVFGSYTVYDTPKESQEINLFWRIIPDGVSLRPDADSEEAKNIVDVFRVLPEKIDQWVEEGLFRPRHIEGWWRFKLYRGLSAPREGRSIDEELSVLREELRERKAAKVLAKSTF